MNRDRRMKSVLTAQQHIPHELHDASKQERTDARNKRAAAQKVNMTKVQALLTDDQKQAWKELTGEPIEIKYPARSTN